MEHVTFRRHLGCTYTISGWKQDEFPCQAADCSCGLMYERTLFENFLKLTDRWNAFKGVGLPAASSFYIRQE